MSVCFPVLEHSGNEIQESREGTENCEIVDLLKKIPGSKEVTDGDVGIWMGPVSYTHLDVYKRQVSPTPLLILIIIPL